MFVTLGTSDPILHLGCRHLDTYSWMSRDEVWAWMSSCWCIKQVAPAGLLFLGHPGLSGWLVRDVLEELQEGHLDPSSLCFLSQHLLFLFCFRSGCWSALCSSVGTGYARSQFLGFFSSTWT